MIVRIYSKHAVLDEATTNYTDVYGSEYTISNNVLQILRPTDERGTLHVPLNNIGAFLVLDETKFGAEHG
jgi:uncharacterized radical SAM superfamily Fe-S cluster-containing enzyme